MIQIDRIRRHALSRQPYEWAAIDRLYSHADAAALVESYPRDRFKTVTGYDGEKGYQYEARSLVHMGATIATGPEGLSSSWRRLVDDLLSNDYRAALGAMSGLDLSTAPLEVNLFHYGAGAWLGPHVDLKDKVVTHVLYFNRDWNPREGGCLQILRSRQMTDIDCEILPNVGNSALIVRSEKSWHGVARVAPECVRSRRSVTVTFYRPGAISTMWPPGDQSTLHDFDAQPEGGRSWREMLGSWLRRSA